MNDFESKVKDGLHPLPGEGFTQTHQNEVMKEIRQSPTYCGKSSRQHRWGLVLGRIAAVAAAVCLVVAVSVEVIAHNKSALREAAQQPPTTSQQVKSLLNQQGWHESGARGTVWTTQLPSSYQLHPGQPPVGLYWAYHNVLSANAGLDMTPYLGQKVEVHAIPLKENWNIGPYRRTDAIAITHQGKVIGAWISKAQENIIVDMCESLNHEEFGDIVNQSWGNWIAQRHLVSYNSGFYAKMKKWTPKQLLQAYFSDVNSHKYNQAYAMRSTFSQYNLITVNLPAGHLYNTQWAVFKRGGLSNWKSAKVLKIAPYKTAVPTRQSSGDSSGAMLYNDASPAAKENLTVSFDATFYTPGPLNNGRVLYFTNVVKESVDAPWTIGGFGTGL